MSNLTTTSHLRRNAVAGALALVFALTSCSGGAAPSGSAEQEVPSGPIEITEELVAAANAEGELTFRFGGPLAMYEALVKEFGREYPDIRVLLDRNAGAAGGAATLTEHQAGVANVDVFEGTDIPSVLDLAASGAIADLEAPNAADFPDDNVIRPGMYAAQNMTSVIGFNTDAYTVEEAEQLTSWETIAELAPGQASYTNPTLTTALAPLLYASETPALGQDWINKFISSRPTVFEGTALARDALASGQQSVAVGQFDSALKAQVASGAPVGFKYPEAAPTWPASFFGVLNNAPNPNAARLFWAWMLSESTCEFAQKAPIFADCALTSVPDAEPVKNSNGEVPDWYQPATDLFTVSNEQWKEATGLRETWEQAQP